MSAEKANKKDANDEAELLSLSKEELAATIVRLQGQVSDREAQAEKKVEKKGSLKDESGKKRRRIEHDGEQQQQQRVSQHKDGAIADVVNDKLLEENERLRAQVSVLQDSLSQAEKKLEQGNTFEDESGRKRRRITLDTGEQQQQQQQRVTQDGDAAMVDGEHGPEKVEKVEEEHEEIWASVELITDLPPALLGYALEYLTFVETRFFFGCGNRALWNRRIEYDAHMTTDLVLPASPPYTLLCNNFVNVCSLDLGRWCSNVVLAFMCDERVLPNMEHLAMARSIGVTDEGLALVPTNFTRRRKLKSLDIQFCRRLSYERMLNVRKELWALEVVRRLPPWLDGMQTFVDDGAIYKSESWADGTFAIWREDGSMEQCGHFCDLYENGSENCVVSKAQIAFDSDENEWQFHAYRIGCTHLRTRGGHILDAEPHSGLYPPNNFPRAEHANSLPSGQFKYFDRQGDVCNDTDPAAYARVGKYRLHPLDSLMPPPEVIELCRAQLSDMHRVMAERNQEQEERHEHVLMGGHENDEPPPEWFQYYP